MIKVLGVTLVIMALIAATIPQFTTCESQGKAITLANGSTVPMTCKWTAQAALATGVPLFAVGSLMAFNRRRESRLSLSVLGILLGIVIVLIPTYLIGVCQSNMLCHTVMRPTLVTTGSISIIAGLVGLIVSPRQRDLT